MVPKLLRTRIAARSTFAILSICGVLGLLFIVVTVMLAARNENHRQHQSLEDLLSTVGNTLTVAAFLNDRVLATEVAEGLMHNATVAGVAIRVGDETLVARGQAIPAAKNNTASNGDKILHHPIHSPFNPEEVLGQINLLPNYSLIRTMVKNTAILVFLATTVLLVIVGLSTIVIVLKLVTRPIERISNRLHGLQAETGEKLEMPKGNEEDEIGRLVLDVNYMIDYLVRTLDQEKNLRQLREQEEKKFRAIFENAETAIFQANRSGELLSFNPAFQRLFADREKPAPGTTLSTLMAEKAPPLLGRISASLAGGKSQQLELHLGETTGQWLHIIVSPVGEDVVQGVANDITERKLVELEAEHRALTDSLTGLGNRAGFENHLAHVVKQSRSNDKGFTLMMIDLDRFKPVNDTYGHHAGDQLLQAIAERLRESARATDYIARPGGDEFTIVLDGVTEEDTAARIATNLLNAIQNPVTLDGGIQVSVGASIGIALSRAGTTTDQIVQEADAAMYEAKHQGRHQFRIWKPIPINP